MPTDHHSHTPRHERDEYRTPGWLFAWAERRFGRFDTDLAATADNALCVSYFDRGADALAHKWQGRCWCNPPYSDLTPWLQKAWMCSHVVMLLPAPQGATWIAELRRAHRLVFIVGRVAFLRPDGTPAHGNTGGSVIAHYNGEPGPPIVEFVYRDTMRST